MTDIFDRVAVKSIDRLIDLLGIEPKTRTVSYQMLAVILRGEWYKEHRVAMNDDVSVFCDQLVEIRIRHKDAVPAQWRVLDVPVIEDAEVPVTELRLVYHDRHEEAVKL